MVTLVKVVLSNTAEVKGLVEELSQRWGQLDPDNDLWCLESKGETLNRPGGNLWYYCFQDCRRDTIKAAVTDVGEVFFGGRFGGESISPLLLDLTQNSPTSIPGDAPVVHLTTILGEEHLVEKEVEVWNTWKGLCGLVKLLSTSTVAMLNDETLLRTQLRELRRRLRHG